MEEIVRVSEVATVLSRIANQPNRREQPRSGDVEGRFDYWFDGGACRAETGCADYVLDSGVKVTTFVVRGLSLWIEFPDGRVVDVRQQLKPQEPLRQFPLPPYPPPPRGTGA